ncbi:hypothetical protein BHK98_08380 [Hornefia porci]|uniref:Uncharacterized protein n=1 Tax=Hornefia porci TaxID=2652292 RepID=A0A1Q9JIP7_9FIRM|nr:hypothetical protein BHK98_08380 [Hornefia porci]
MIREVTVVATMVPPSCMPFTYAVVSPMITVITNIMIYYHRNRKTARCFQTRADAAAHSPSAGCPGRTLRQKRSGGGYALRKQPERRVDAENMGIIYLSAGRWRQRGTVRQSAGEGKNGA